MSTLSEPKFQTTKLLFREIVCGECTRASFGYAQTCGCQRVIVVWISLDRRRGGQPDRIKNPKGQIMLPDWIWYRLTKVDPSKARNFAPPARPTPRSAEVEFSAEDAACIAHSHEGQCFEGAL